MTLANAILLYSGGGSAIGKSASAFASIHDVEHGTDGPIIAAGKPLTRQHLRRWAEALGRNAKPEILPANVIAAHPDVLAWWVPEQVRPAHFDLSRPPTGLQALAQKTTIAVPYPAHLFVATRTGLGVYALPSNARPAAETPVLHSPVLNVFLGGQLCWGNIAKPRALSVSAMAEYERAVFDSWSTHPNAGQDQTVTGKSGLVRLWDALAARKAKRFPVRRLKTFFPQQRRPAEHRPITVAQIIEWAC
ncbi:PRTRC system protein B [Sphingomonas sp. ABOLE]|nr:PRTRC system protein B [Sphingomonas sp. ABOLE]RSV44506.1 PRTRC system protein B [Sphingomonas sp. ABOLE]